MNNYEQRKQEKIETLEEEILSIEQELKLVKAQLEVIKNDDSFSHVDVSILAGSLRACCEVKAENIATKIMSR